MPRGQAPFLPGVVGYIDDMVPGGGGLAVWPSSHRCFFHAFHSRYLFAPTQNYCPLILEHDGREPVDCHGRAGDVVLYHHRLCHKTGHNESNRLRIAVLYDFTRSDLLGPVLSGEPNAARYLSARVFTALPPAGRRLARTVFGGKLFEPPGEDMWVDWSEALQTASAD